MALKTGMRAVAAGLGFGLLAASAQAGGFPPVPGGRFADVRVDVRPLLAQGGGLQAEALRADLTAALRRSFAGRLGGTGPSLVVVVRSLSMRPFAGGQSGGGRSGAGGGTQSDYLEGEALLVGRGGQVLGRHPQLTATPASYGGAWYDPASERNRVSAIADIYAAWLARDLPTD